MSARQIRGSIAIDPRACVMATEFIDCDHPMILGVVEKLRVREIPERDRARALFYFVRDRIIYEFIFKPTRKEYAASYVLEQGRGFCVQKAILLAALGRAAGVPTALVVTDLTDHTLSAELVQAMGTDILYHHGLNAFYLDGKWVCVDASLSADLVARKRYREVVFDGQNDALLSNTTETGEPHVEYGKIYGAFADFDFAAMISAFASGYQNADTDRMKRILEAKETS